MLKITNMRINPDNSVSADIHTQVGSYLAHKGVHDYYWTIYPIDGAPDYPRGYAPTDERELSEMLDMHRHFALAETIKN